MPMATRTIDIDTDPSCTTDPDTGCGSSTAWMFVIAALVALPVTQNSMSLRTDSNMVSGD